MSSKYLIFAILSTFNLIITFHFYLHLKGDSGGPLEKKLIFHSRRVPFLFGITSFGPACGYTTPAVYTKVSSFIDWIQLKTNTTFNPIDCSVKNYIFRDVDDDVIVGERSNVVGEQESVNAHLANIQKKFTRGFAEQVSS